MGAKPGTTRQLVAGWLCRRMGEVRLYNQDIKAAKDYHDSTKLSYINLRNKPPLYKSYSGFPVTALPTELDLPEISTLDALSRDSENSTETHILDLQGLARVLYFSAGVLHKRFLPKAGEIHYRASSSAGALYPVEVYVVAGDMPGLDSGVYHFSPDGFALTQLRKGDFRRELATATADDPTVAAAPLTLVFTGVFWKSAWKYRVRSYRYCFWDAGTILSNLLATIKGVVGTPSRLLTGFVDDQVNNLLGIDSQREASLCLVPIGETSGTISEVVLNKVEPLAIPENNSSEDEISYPEILLAHSASNLGNVDEVRAWLQVAVSSASEALSPQPNNGAGSVVESSSNREGLLAASLGATIQQRGSTRRFARSSISRAQFEAILDVSTMPVPGDFLRLGEDSLLDVYIITNAVEGLTSGSYYFSPVRRRLELLQGGDFREEAGHLCFEQALGADSSAVLYFLADLDRVLERYGNRGYRAAQLEAGIMVGNAYLLAHSLGLGATGTTFYDDDVTEFFSPHAEGKSMMFLVAIGATAEQNRVRPFRSRVGVMLDSKARGAGAPQISN